MIKDLKTNKDKVEHLLKNYPETRDSDKLLWLAFMVVNSNLKSVLNNDLIYKKFKSWLLNTDIPTFESLTRLRRKFQENGKYLGTKRIEKIEESFRVKEWSKQTSFL